MKIVFTIIALMVAVSCSSQEFNFPPGCWMPEKYISTVKEKPFGNHMDNLKPVESIVISGDSIFMKTYGGDFMHVQTKKTDSDRIELINAQQLFNLDYFSKEELKDLKIFLARADAYLLLHVQHKGNDHYVRFVNNIDGLDFTSSNEPFFRSALKGRYISRKEPVMEIVITLDGEIKGTSLWNSYQFRRYHSKSTNGVDYVLLTLRRTDGTKADFAVQISETELIMWDYVASEKSDFEIVIQGEPSYKFRKVL